MPGAVVAVEGVAFGSTTHCACRSHISQGDRKGHRRDRERHCEMAIQESEAKGRSELTT